MRRAQVFGQLHPGHDGLKLIRQLGALEGLQQEPAFKAEAVRSERQLAAEHLLEQNPQRRLRRPGLLACSQAAAMRRPSRKCSGRPSSRSSTCVRVRSASRTRADSRGRLSASSTCAFSSISRA